MFTVTSRYYGLPVGTHTAVDSRVVAFVRRRLLPDPDSLATIGLHTVKPGERLDLIAAKEIGDPEQAWRIADAHRVLDPDTLTQSPGRRLRITLPAGIPAAAGPLSASAGNGG
jgi:hypothetical protein